MPIEPTPPVGADGAEPSAIEPEAVTLELGMADPDWIGNPPEDPYWADDSSAVFFSQKRQGEEHREVWQVNLEGESGPLTAAEVALTGAPRGDWSRDRTRRVYTANGDLFLRDLVTGRLSQLTRTSAVERSPRFLADSGLVSYMRGESLMVRDLGTGLEYEPAEIVLGDDPQAEEEEPSFLAAQEERLVAYTRERKAERKAAMERERQEREADPNRVPPPFYLGKGVEVQGLSLSPTGRWLLVVLGKEDEDRGRADLMPNYVTESGYVETQEVRPKVGTGEGAGESLVLLDLERHRKYELDTSVLPGIMDDPLAALEGDAEPSRSSESELEEEDISLEEEILEEEALDDSQEGIEEDPPPAPSGLDASGTPGSPGPDSSGSGSSDGGNGGSGPRAVNFHQPVWSEDGRRLALMVRSVDNKDRWIATVDFESLELVPVHRLHDEAWINWRYNEMHWLPDGDRLLYLSEETGYSHLYLEDLAFGTRRQLTTGDYEVANPQLTQDGRAIYFTANPAHPGQYETFRADVETGLIDQITFLGGVNQSWLSPDGTHLAILHSTTTMPPELYLQSTALGSLPRRVTYTVSERFQAIEWVEPAIVEIPSSAVDASIYARLYLPEQRLESPAPAVFFVHGAGYLQNAHQGWSGYFREFFFHQVLTRMGYVVLDMDYRASAGYGRDWRTAIYRQMGTPELEDLRDGVDWLVANHDVDRDRIGVYGGSYGGFLALMALFTEQDLFAAGAALRPVTDWAHYNHPYTSNILNTPEVDPEAFRRSSPIEFAAGLEKPLLICAPMQDDNVLFQDVVRLAQVLIELEKEDWEVAIFPIEPHSFREPSSWLNEYRRILKLFETEVR